MAEEGKAKAVALEVRPARETFLATPEWVKREEARLGRSLDASPPLYVRGRPQCRVDRKVYEEAKVAAARIEVGVQGEARTSSTYRRPQ